MVKLGHVVAPHSSPWYGMENVDECLARGHKYRVRGRTHDLCIFGKVVEPLHYDKSIVKLTLVDFRA